MPLYTSHNLDRLFEPVRLHVGQTRVVLEARALSHLVERQIICVDGLQPGWFGSIVELDVLMTQTSPTAWYTTGPDGLTEHTETAETTLTATCDPATTWWEMVVQRHDPRFDQLLARSDQVAHAHRRLVDLVARASRRCRELYRPAAGVRHHDLGRVSLATLEVVADRHPVKVARRLQDLVQVREPGEVVVSYTLWQDDGRMSSSIDVFATGQPGWFGPFERDLAREATRAGLEG